MPSITPPLGQALILCDHAWRDPSTGKFSLLGSFSTIMARQVPAQHPQIAVYFALTELRGKVPIVLRVVWLDPDAHEDKEVLRVDGEANSNDPLGVLEAFIGLKNVVFERAGEYRVQLLSSESPILERRLIVKLVGTSDTKGQ